MGFMQKYLVIINQSNSKESKLRNSLKNFISVSFPFLMLTLNIKIILGLTVACLALVVIIFGYFMIKINNDLNILLENRQFDDATKQIIQQQEQEQEQTRGGIKNISENGIDKTLEQRNESSSLSQSKASTAINPEFPLGQLSEQSKIFPYDFIESALIPDPSLIISVIFRTAIIATLVFIIVKWLGGKGIGQLSPFGLIIIIGLGSAVGDPMIYKDMSIPQAMAAVIIVVIFFKLIDNLTLKNKRFRNLVQPRPLLLVEYGYILKENLNRSKMAKEDLEVQMRLNGIADISEIKKAQLETNGQISFIVKKNTRND